MKKIIENKTVYFYDDTNQEIMHFNYLSDECIWYFNTNKKIIISPDMELYPLIHYLMNQSYLFSKDILKNQKNDNRLTWYSDCFYDPDDEWSVASVSCLNIERNGNNFIVWCSKKLDEIIGREGKAYCICFSPAGNGKYSQNLNTGLTLQDDFIIQVYQKLLLKNQVLELN